MAAVFPEIRSFPNPLGKWIIRITSYNVCYTKLLRRLDSRLKHLLLDEFQDTSVIQFDILRPLIEEIRSGVGVNEGGSFFFVGDVKQSIYRFRGGVSALFHQVAELFDVRVEPLRVNYRSRSKIVDFVNRSFEGKIKGYIPQQSPQSFAGGYVEVVSSDELLQSLGERVAFRITSYNVCYTKLLRKSRRHK